MSWAALRSPASASQKKFPVWVPLKLCSMAILPWSISVEASTVADKPIICSERPSTTTTSPTVKVLILVELVRAPPLVEDNVTVSVQLSPAVTTLAGIVGKRS